MIKTLAAHIGEYKKASIITPVFMILEVVFETLIPFLMASHHRRRCGSREYASYLHGGSLYGRCSFVRVVLRRHGR